MASKYIGGNNRFLTESLFYETSKNREGYPPPFTLKASDHEGSVSLKRLYMEHGDPTEYEFAMEVLGSWQHWEYLTELSWFKPHVEEWRSELSVALCSEATRTAMDVLKNPEAPAATKMQAARYVADRGWKPKAEKGRPKKEDIQKAAREKAESNVHWDADFKRIMNNGN